MELRIYPSMSYYKFNHDVYLVNGAKKSCLYDFNRNHLYNISQYVVELCHKLVNENDAYTGLNPDDKQIADELIQSNLLVSFPTSEPIPDILSLRKQPSPRFSWIEVTRKCNLSCTFCYEESNPYCTERMSLEDFYHVCAELKEVGVKEIQFIGGEPMILKGELKTMIMHARPLFDFIEVYSNGVLIDEEWAKFFKENNIAVALSIHSYLPEEHDQLTTVKGSHRKVLRALGLLKKHEVRHRIGTVRSTSCNIGDKPEGCGFSLLPKEPKVVGRADFSQYNLEMFKRKAITKQSKTHPINKQMVITALSGHQCFIKDLYISSLLDVFPCVMERRLKHGNLKNNKLKDILDNKIRYLSKDNIEGCKNCEFRYACFDCRPDSNGRGVYQKPWYCTYNPNEGKWYDVETVFNGLVQNSKKNIESIPVVCNSGQG